MNSSLCICGETSAAMGRGREVLPETGEAECLRRRPRMLEAGYPMLIGSGVLRAGTNGDTGFVALFFFWVPDRARLQVMDELLPPGPVLFFKLMAMLNPSRLKQLFSSLRVTDYHRDLFFVKIETSFTTLSLFGAWRGVP